MTLHIFNPEHDIALASGLENFTAPHAGRQLRHDLGFLPALWAAADDCVLVEDVEQAQASLKRLAVAAKKYLGVEPNLQCSMVNGQWSMFNGQCSTSVDPWGWDAALRGRLRRMGVTDELLPGDDQLIMIRELSHRRTSALLLQRLADDGLATAVGVMPVECRTAEEVEAALAERPKDPTSATPLRGEGRVVMKAPWSSSGRGVRFVDLSPHLLTSPSSLQGWLRGVLSRQGSVMVEPYYNKVKDFGMEFEAGADGTVSYCGLSLFHTANGAYTGNIVATEQRKREMMGRYLPAELLDQVRERLCHHLTNLLQGRYQGPLGVDMMIVCGDCKSPQTNGTLQRSECRQTGFLLHPCVEINLRRTMGHAALALTPCDDDRMGVMRITYANGCYKLGVERFSL